MIHAHMSAWLLAIILFVATYLLQNKGKNTKVLKMILRVSYLLLLGTGGMLLMSISNISGGYILKALFGVGMIAIFEIMLARNGRGDSTKALWPVFILFFILLLYLGFTLPLGTYIG